MTVIRSLLGERRAIDASQFPYAMTEESKTYSGIPVDQGSAMTYGAVYACIRINSEIIASMPWKIFKVKGEERTEVARPPAWLTQPNPECGPFDFKQRAQASLEADGNAYIFIGALDSLGYPAELWALHPSECDVKRNANGTKYVEFSSNGHQEHLEMWNPIRPAVGTVLHIKGFNTGGLKGLSPIDQGRQAIGLGLVTERFGSDFFGRGQNPSGVIELEKGVKADENFRKAIKESWIRSQGGVDKAHLPAVLAGATWKPITITPENAQFLETRKHQVGEVARWFGVPPWVIGDVEKSTSWGSGIEQQFIGWKQVGLQPRATRLEQALSTLIPRGQVLRLNLMGLLRGDQKSRYEAYAIAVQNGWQTRNEVRHLEDMNSLDGLDDPLQPLNMTTPKQENPA